MAQAQQVDLLLMGMILPPFLRLHIPSCPTRHARSMRNNLYPLLLSIWSLMAAECAYVAAILLNSCLASFPHT